MADTLHRNLITVSCTKPGLTPAKITPKIMVINVRSIVKTDAAPALHAELQSKNVDICIITETWLNSKVSSSLVYPDGYVIVRKDRKDDGMGGGVATFAETIGKSIVLTLILTTATTLNVSGV